MLKTIVDVDATLLFAFDTPHFQTCTEYYLLLVLILVFIFQLVHKSIINKLEVCYKAAE